MYDTKRIYNTMTKIVTSSISIIHFVVKLKAYSNYCQEIVRVSTL